MQYVHSCWMIHSIVMLNIKKLKNSVFSEVHEPFQYSVCISLLVIRVLQILVLLESISLLEFQSSWVIDWIMFLARKKAVFLSLFPSAPWLSLALKNPSLSCSFSYLSLVFAKHSDYLLCKKLKMCSFFHVILGCRASIILLE